MYMRYGNDIRDPDWLPPLELKRVTSSQYRQVAAEAAHEPVSNNVASPSSSMEEIVKNLEIQSMGGQKKAPGLENNSIKRLKERIESLGSSESKIKKRLVSEYEKKCLRMTDLLSMGEASPADKETWSSREHAVVDENRLAMKHAWHRAKAEALRLEAERKEDEELRGRRELLDNGAPREECTGTMSDSVELDVEEEGLTTGGVLTASLNAVKSTLRESANLLGSTLEALVADEEAEAEANRIDRELEEEQHYRLVEACDPKMLTLLVLIH